MFETGLKVVCVCELKSSVHKNKHTSCIELCVYMNVFTGRSDWWLGVDGLECRDHPLLWVVFNTQTLGE